MFRRNFTDTELPFTASVSDLPLVKLVPYIPVMSNLPGP